VAQSVEAGFMSPSGVWQVKHVAWFGVVLNVPFFNQKASSANLFGRAVANSSSDFPCG
jgi:hypothetical protein